MNPLTEPTPRLTALVTGASSGIGVHYARELIRKGYNVILVSNQALQIRETASALAAEAACTDLSGEPDNGFANRITENIPTETNRPQGQWVMGIYKDLADPRAAKELWDFCEGRSMCVDILINNAGVFIFNDTADCPPERIVLLLNLHIQAVTLLCRYFGAAMKERRGGYILNMSSISAHTPFPGISLYTGSKSYIRTFTRALHYEMTEYGVKVMAVSPGAVATDLYNLPPSLQKLGVKLGIIYRPGKLARKALKKLMRGKSEYIPGAVNRFFKPVFIFLPGCLIIKIRQKLKPLMR